MRKTLIALAAASIAFAAPAAAQETGVATISVETGDLNLTTATGLERLNIRLDTAIRQACRNGGRDLASRRAEAACRADLSEAAAQSVELAVYEASLIRLGSNELNDGNQA